MPNIYNFSEQELLAFALVLMRLSAFIVAWPIFGSQQVPSVVKILLSFILTVVVFPIVSWNQVGASLATMQLPWLVMREIFVGVSLGFMCRFFFFAVEMMGHVISLSMGLSSAQMFNPATGSNSTTIEQLHVMLASLLFLAINGHHLFLHGIVQSFEIVPLSVNTLSLSVFESFGSLLGQLMLISVKMSAPVLIAILFINLAMAVIGRAVPQINVLITSLPVNILAGFFVIIVGLPLLLWEMKDILELATQNVFNLMKHF